MEGIEKHKNVTPGDLIGTISFYFQDDEVMDWLCLAALAVAFRLLSFIILLIKAKLST
jgi:hypothetical protein